jgi:Holliday junction resolvase-like predicted endonuclease
MRELILETSRSFAPPLETAVDQPRRAGNRRRGTWACRYLEARGLILVTRNFRCACGELDLIMRDGEQLVFVEVRSRRHSRYGTPAESVTRVQAAALVASGGASTCNASASTCPAASMWWRFSTPRANRKWNGFGMRSSLLEIACSAEVAEYSDR